MSNFTKEQDERLIELYNQKNTEKVPSWDAIVVLMNTEFFERVPRFTNDGLRSRYKRIKNKLKGKKEPNMQEMPPGIHPFASCD